MVDEIDEMNKANLDELLEGRKKNVEGGRIGYDQGGQLVQPRQGFYRKGFVKPNRLTKEEIDQRYKAKKLRENPNYKAEADRRWKAKKLRENPDWTPYKAGTHYKKRLEAKEKGLVYDMETGKFRKEKTLKKYHKFLAAGDKKLISEWKKSLTDAAKKGDMSETLPWQTYLTKKYGAKKAQTIRNRVRLQLNFAPVEVSNIIQEDFIKSLVKKHNESDKILYSKKDIFNKIVLDRNQGPGRELWFKLDDQLENLDTKINRAFDKIIDDNLPLKMSKKVSPYTARYNPIIQMIAEMAGGDKRGSTTPKTIQNALLKNPKFQDKKFVETFRYLGKTHAKDFIGLPFDEAFEYAKMRQGGLDIKGLLSYTTRYQNPESNIMSFAVRHANRHFREDTKSQIQFYKLRADGTKGAPLPWEKLPKNKDGNRVLDINKVGFEYKDQFFHRNNLKTKGYKSGLFDEVYAMSGKNRLLVPDPNDPSQKITLKKLLEMTGDKLTVGHDEALGGVKGAPFKNLRLQGFKLNTALFNAYDKIQNKDLRARVLHSLEGQFKGLSGDDYQKAFIEGKVNEAKDIINKKIDVSKKGTLYREAGREIVEDPAFKTFSPKKQREAMRIAGKNKIKFLQSVGFPIKKCLSRGVGGSPDQCITGVINETIEKAKRGDADAIKIFKNQKQVLKQAAKRGTGLATKLSWFVGPVDVPIELAFALPHLLMGDYEAAKRATTGGLFGWGKIDLDNVDDPEARKYLKHRRDTADWINNWEKHDYYTNKLENLPADASDALRNDIEARVNKRASNMDSIAQTYDGYDRSGSENEAWAYNPEEMAGKKAARNWIDTKVETDLEKGLDATYRKQETPVGEIDISAYKDAAREKLRASPTDLESFIKTKGQDFYGDPEGWFFYNPLKQQEAEAYGVGDIYDDYHMGALSGKNIRESYSSIPLKYASQLGAMEAKETREGLEAIRERQYSSPLNEMYYAGGGIAGLSGGKRFGPPPLSGPDSQGLAYLNNYATKRTE
jgi:hypothetical protein